MEKCFLQRSKFGPDDYSRVDIVTLKPAVFHLQDKMNVVVESDDGIGVLPFQMMNLPDHSVAADVGGGKRLGTILHPKRSTLRIGQDKNHSFILGEVRAEHHSGLLLDGGQRHLGTYFFRANPKFYGAQFWLGFRWEGRRGVGRGQRSGSRFSLSTPRRNQSNHHQNSAKSHEERVLGE